MNSQNIDLLKKFDLAIKEHQLGNHEQAKKLYRKILTIDANNIPIRPMNKNEPHPERSFLVV